MAAYTLAMRIDAQEIREQTSGACDEIPFSIDTTNIAEARKD
ncbi:hypothetical protein [Streptomyces sp. NPDC015350]